MAFPEGRHFVKLLPCLKPTQTRTWGWVKESLEWSGIRWIRGNKDLLRYTALLKNRAKNCLPKGEIPHLAHFMTLKRPRITCRANFRTIWNLDFEHWTWVRKGDSSSKIPSAITPNEGLSLWSRGYGRKKFWGLMHPLPALLAHSIRLITTNYQTNQCLPRRIRRPGTQARRGSIGQWHMWCTAWNFITSIIITVWYVIFVLKIFQ